MYSGKPAASLVVSDLVAEHGLGQPAGLRRLNDSGQQAVEVTAERMAELVDELLGKRWNRHDGAFVELEVVSPNQETTQAACSCGSGIPVQAVVIDGKAVNLIALPLIFQKMQEAGKLPSEALAGELLETVRIYNPVPAEAEAHYAAALLREYTGYCSEKEVSS